MITIFNTDIMNIKNDPNSSNITYLGTYNQGVFKSIDGGDTWSAITSGFPVGSYQPFPMIFDPTNSNILYAGGKLSKTTTGGQSWSVITVGITQNVRTIAIDPTNSQILYVGTSDYIYKSTNGGNTWTQLTTLTSALFNGIAVDSSNPQIIYAGAHAIPPSPRLYKSINGGATWLVSTTGLNDSPYGSLLIDPSNSSTLFVCTDNGLYRSTNAGETWSKFGGNISGCNQVVITINGTTTIFLTGTGAIWCYTISATGISTTHWQQFNDTRPIITDSDMKLSNSSSKLH